MAADWLDDSLFGNSGDTTNAALRNPITAFNFVLEVEGVYFMALKTVKVFSKENEYEYIREGGVNDYVHMRRKPISKPFTFQVERYVSNERFMDPLANGTELMLPVILYVYRHQTRSAITESAPAWPARIYTFTGCVVTQKEYGELNAEKSGLLTETTTIAYRELMVVTNPTWGPDQDLPAWKFSEHKDEVFPKNTYAATGSLAHNEETYEKAEDPVLKKTVWKRKDAVYTKENNSTNKPYWSIKSGVTGHTDKYADQTAVGTDDKIYGKDDDGNTKRIDSAAKHRLDGYDLGTEVMWADGTNMTAQKHYTKDADGWTMSDGSVVQKPRKEEYTDAKPKYAKDTNVKSPDNYSVITDDDGVSRTFYVGGDERFDKPPYSEFLEGDLPIWANATNAVSDEHYEWTPGEGGWESTDGTAKKRADSFKDGGKVKYADSTNEVSDAHYKKLPPNEGGWESTDDTAKKPQSEYKDAKPTWADDTNAVSGDHYSPKPGEGGWEVSDGTGKPKWDIRSNTSNPKPSNAEPARNGDAPPPARTPWDIKGNKDNPKVTYAKAATNGDGKQPAKGPWSMQQNKENPKAQFAKPATNGDGKQPAREPWDIKANQKDPKPTYAVPATNGDKKQTPVTWPPTRRALMADSLSKK